MATLTGSTIASSYEQLLSLPDGGGNTTTLVAVTDGDAGTTFAMQLSTTTVCIDNPTADSSTQGGILRLQSDDGALMQSGSRLGVIEFAGAEDSSNTITVGARIESLTTEAWDASNNDADLLFYTTSGNASTTEKVRIDSSGDVEIKTGNLKIGTSGKGINFDAYATSGNPSSNLLDDYEEGTWTPVLKSGSNTISQTGGTNTAVYTKIGNLVTVDWSFSGVETAGTLAANTQIDGLPFTASTATYALGSTFHSYVLHLDLVPNACRVDNDGTSYHLISQPASANYANCTIDAVGAGSYGGFTVTYYAS